LNIHGPLLILLLKSVLGFVLQVRDELAARTAELQAVGAARASQVFHLREQVAAAQVWDKRILPLMGCPGSLLPQGVYTRSGLRALSHPLSPQRKEARPLSHALTSD
jgi:hypothetical protein